jgi:hypothetical protein
MEVAEVVSADGDGVAFLSAGANVLALIESGFLNEGHGYPPPPPDGVGWFVCFQYFSGGSFPAMPLILLGLDGF